MDVISGKETNRRINRAIKLSAAAIALFGIAGVTPEKGQLVELQNFVNARSESKFRSSDNNKVYELRKGTKTVIAEEPVAFKDPTTKKPYAYGLCLHIINAEVSAKKDCYWVYYKASHKNLELLDVTGRPRELVLESWNKNTDKKIAVKTLNQDYKSTADTKIPVKNQTVIIKQPTVAVVEPAKKVDAAASTSLASTSGPAKITTTPSVGHPSGADSIAKSVVTKAGEVADRLNTSLTSGGASPQPAKGGCNGACGPKPLSKDEVCDSRNNYLENEMAQLKSDPQTIVAQLLKIPAPEKYIKDACFATALQFTGGTFKTCDKKHILQQSPRACASTDLKKVVRTAFDLTIDCLGEFLTNDPKTVNSAATNFFFMVAHESGHNPNAVSWRGAGGSTQLTDPINTSTNKPAGAISHFNKVEKPLMLDFLKRKHDPRCAPIKQVVEQGMGEGPANTCDRISMGKGNPLLNLVYGLGYQRHLRNTVRKFLTENPMAARVFGQANPQTKEFLENQLSLWSHNTGPGGMTSALTRYVSLRPNKPIVTVKDAEEMLVAMKSAIRVKGRGAAEPTNYLAAINKGADYIQQSIGGGTCAVKSN